MSGVLAAPARVAHVLGRREVAAGGTGKKFVLELEYEGADLPREVFVKFSRNFDDELKDRGRFQAVSETAFAVLSATSDFPVRVPRTLFADIDSASFTGLIISECIPYGRDGVEPYHPKCLDHEMADPLGHYQAILRGLAALAGADRSGRLPEGFADTFPYDRDTALAPSPMDVPEATALRRATRMFDFVGRHPQLFPEHLRSTEFREQFLRDIHDVVAAAASIRHLLHADPDRIVFAHWNANVDNCWFWRDPDGLLHSGFLDWANAGRIGVAQSITGALSGADVDIWTTELDGLLALYVREFAAHGGPELDPFELRRQVLLAMASGFAWSMGAPIALPRVFDDIDALTGPRDPALRTDDNARTQLHIMTRMLGVWHAWSLGDLVRSLE